MEKLLEILKGIKSDVDFKNSKNLVEDGLIDSFDIVTIIAAVNEEFDIDFPVNEIMPENFNSAESLYKIIEKLEEN